MNYFSKLRFPKTSLSLFIIGVLVLAAIPFRIMLGASLNLPNKGADIQLPIILIAASFLILSLLLWALLRKKGIRFMDVGYPLGTLSAIAIFIYFHITFFI